MRVISGIYKLLFYSLVHLWWKSSASRATAADSRVEALNGLLGPQAEEELDKKSADIGIYD